MTALTPSQQLPYPASGRESGNGALDLQRLAEAADRQLDRLDTAWAAQLARPAKTITISADYAIGVNQNIPLQWDTLTYGVGGLSSVGAGLAFTDPALAGYYHIIFDLCTLEVGAVTGIRRLLIAQVEKAAPGADDILETYRQEEFQVSGNTDNHLSFVTYMDETIQVVGYFFHNNTGSTVNAKTTSTHASMYRICPRLV